MKILYSKKGTKDAEILIIDVKLHVVWCKNKRRLNLTCFVIWSLFSMQLVSFQNVCAVFDQVPEIRHEAMRIVTGNILF